MVVPGADESTGFIGDNLGRIVDPSTDVGALGWPYDGAAAQASLAAASLSPGTPSDWIPVHLSDTADRVGAFRMYRLVGGWLWVSPVYRSFRSARAYRGDAPAGLFYVADDPAWIPKSDRLGEYFFEHEKDLADARSWLAALFASEGPALVVYFDPSIGLVELAYAVEAETGVESETLRDAYRAVDARVGSLMSAVSEGTSIVLLGRRAGMSPATAGVVVSPGGFAVIGSSSAGSAIAQHVETVDAARVGEMLLAALPPDDERASRKEGFPMSRSDITVPLTVDSLRKLGLLSSSSNAVAAATEQGRDTVTSASSPAR